MSEAAKDTQRAIAAVKAILDGRDPQTDFPAILVTLEHAIAAALVLLMKEPRAACHMLHEGLLLGVEDRILLYANRSGK